MPRATADTTKTEHFDLKTLPEAFVKLRQLSYGEMLARQDMATRTEVKGTNRKDAQMIVDTMQEIVTQYEFQRCIVDHNLEDENGTKLNFQIPGTISRLDPKVGSEIGTLIDDMNQFDAADLTPGSDSSSSATESPSPTLKSVESSP